MNADYRGGNSRLLTRALEQKMLPMAVLDESGAVVYVNGKLCELVQLDSTVLVGKRCTWHIPQDREPAGLLLSALAPPESAREGAIAARKFTTPPIFGSDIDAELFVPLIDADGHVSLIIVVMGRWQEISRQMPQQDSASTSNDIRSALVQLRAKNDSLDGLDALLGTSHTSRLSLSRAQLAIQANLSVLITGPSRIGKSTVAQAIYNGRLAKHNVRAMTGAFITIDGEVAGFEQVAGQLETLHSRLRPELTKVACALFVRRMDLMDDLAMSQVMNFVNSQSERCTFFASVTAEGRRKRETRSSVWGESFAKLSALELTIESLAARREDIPVLVNNCVARIAQEAGRTPPPIRPDAMELFLAYNWPRNFAELNEVLRHAVLHSIGGEAISVNHLPAGIRAFPGTVHQADSVSVEAIRLDDVLEEVEREVIRRALAASPRNRAGAARLLGISRPRLLRRIEALGLGDKKSDKKPDDQSELSAGDDSDEPGY